MENVIKEACVENIEEAILAQNNGANQIELCSRLDLDGLTPGRNLTQKLLSLLSIPVKVMIRPRSGHLRYSNAELDEMKDDILYFKSLHVKGVVLGMLEKDGNLDLKQIGMLAAIAKPLEVTVHKAIDLCHDPVNEIEQLMKITNITSILTSGKASTAIEGKDMIRAMIEKAGDAIEIIAAGKITSSNFTHVHHLIKSTAYHGRRIVDAFPK